ncbi:MAG: fumarylacetoacetate hydrolase family protein [Chloroflexi bacterium OHK40]
MTGTPLAGYLTRHQTPAGPRWALDGRYLPVSLTLAELLAAPLAEMVRQLHQAPVGEVATEPLLAPVEPDQEVWASGVTYLRSRDAREAESSARDVYARVYNAERPELFFKAIGRRVVGPGGVVGIRYDSSWDVPEPEIVLVVNSALEIVGYCAGNDMSSRSIEGENPLYLPQAKTYDRSCALGPGIRLAPAEELAALQVRLSIWRAGAVVFAGETRAAQMRRRFTELVHYLGRALSFPYGALLMTGTGIVPPESFTLQPGDRVEIRVGDLALVNDVAMTPDRRPEREARRA